MSASHATEWRIYYDNGTTCDSRSRDPESAPSFGVVVIAFPDPVVGRVLMHGWDWYYWVPTEGQWWGSDIHGLLDRLLHNLPLQAVKQGRNVSNLQYAEIMGRARDDPDFPVKSAERAGEHP